MIIKAEQKHIRISPRKIRTSVANIRHLPPKEALLQLQFMTTRSSIVISKVIKQALANATNNFKQNPDLLRFNTIEVNEGATFKRWQPVSRGRAHSILKRSSHLSITLKSLEPKTTTPPSTKQTTATPDQKPTKSKANKSSTTKNKK